MEDINTFITWLMNSFKRIYDFVTQQHPIVQARVFMPIAVLVVGLFFTFIKSLFNGRSIG